MNIVDASPDQVSLEEASQLAGRSTKTLRRAIQEGHFQRRYVLSPRGPQLVFRRDELDQWLAKRSTKQYAPVRAQVKRAPSDEREWQELFAHVASLQVTLNANRETLDALAQKLREQDRAIAHTQQVLAALLTRLARQQEGAAAPREEPLGAPTAH